jgi:dihydropteroate synthase
MSGHLYLRPCGLLHGNDAREAVAAGNALLLAGGPCAFTRVEILSRRDAGGAEGRTFSLAALPRAGGIPSDFWDDWLARVTTPRPPLTGFDFSVPRLMGIVNVTPDSFSDGGRNATPDTALAHARRLCAEGADILDIGGESTRPGSDPVPLEEERARVLPVLRALSAEIDVPISIDTRKARLMREAAQGGAAMVNDVSALRHDPDALAAVAETGLAVVLMHMQGEPATMQNDPRYDDVLLDVYDHLYERITACEAVGIPYTRIVVDPGIGFGKTLDHNLRLLANLSLLHGLGCSIVLGASRKGFIGRLSGGAPPDRRVGGSLAAVLAGAAQGVQIFRVHDVFETRQALSVWRAIGERD